MSKTDKTRPYWVQMRDDDFPYELHALHRVHNYKHECDIDFPLPPTRRERRGCEWWPRYNRYDKIWGRSRYRRSYEFKQDRRARASLRRLTNEWRKLIDVDDIDSTEDLPTQKWLWKGWYWD